MSPYLDTLNFTVAVGSLVLFLAALILLIDLFTKRELVSLVSRYALWVAFSVTLIASLLALVYSDVFGLVPCGLCWVQRIFLFPQVFILGTGQYLNDRKSQRYGIVLSIFGLVVALYQHYLQMGGTPLGKCPTTGGSADCAERFYFEFGFLTFPLISAIVFFFLITLYFYSIRIRKNEAVKDVTI